MLFIYITFPSQKEAEKVGKILVEEELARCVNIIPGMESLFIWQGSMRSERECILIAKTVDSNYAKLERRVKQLHSYKVPCIIAFKVSKGSQEFIKWVES
ncbi:divalent-cation tolerance protein CutA [Candidatus Micrarchaeota archaeon]|nr:divalent-cation tolerance protein CutA [Candidatus Micrarchaeota archaeon]